MEFQAKRMHARGMTQQEIAEVLGVNQSTVSRLIAARRVAVAEQSDEQVLLCPLCTYDYTHVVSCESNFVHAWCENCCKEFDIVFTQHKGQTFLTVDNITEHYDVP